jgi:hypothetical protein
VLVGAGALAAAWYSLLPPPTPLIEPLPHPNGYDDLVAAGQMVSDELPDLKTATVEALAGFVVRNRAALDRARLGLTRQCRVPTEYSLDYLDRHDDYDLSAARRIAGVLGAEGRLAELENHAAEAATNYLTVMKLGVELDRGGVLIDALVAIACESLGTKLLANEVPKLTAEQSHALARNVEDLEATREPMEKIVEHEHAFRRSGLNGIRNMIGSVVLRRRLRVNEQQVVSRYYQNCRPSLELQGKLAAHAFELEKGRPATGWNDLVPAYLKRIPFDPGTTNQLPFVVR